MAPTMGIKVGTAIVARMNAVQTSACSNGSNQPASKARTEAGADSVRRRLSNIFQRPIDGMAQRLPFATAVGPCPRIHGRSCQSPRAQRW
jgi:hypothetical protein